jgi:diguanylate cyclase (GGDEF)-like protein
MNDRKLRVLLAEGASGEAAQALRALFPETSGGLDLTIVSSLTTLLPTINVVDPEVLLLDLALIRPDSLDSVRRVHRSAPAVPLIVFGDPADKQQAALCLREGAMDYLLKGFMDTRTLDRVVRTALERNTLRGLTDLLRDSLTGLYIRDGLLTLGSRAMEKARSSDSTLVLLCTLVENLHSLREAFGPGAADRSLCEVAAILSESFRRTDLISRIGDAQFAALAVDAAEPSASVLRQRVERHIAVRNQERGPWGPLDLRISVGFWSPKDHRYFPEFLDAVEAGLRNGTGILEGQAAIPDATVEA